MMLSTYNQTPHYVTVVGSFCFVADPCSLTISLPMMKRYGIFGLLGFIGLSAVLALPARAENAPRILLSEINWAGSENSTADEWIELVNLESHSVDVSQYVLTGVATGGAAIEIANGTILAPGDTLLIANYAAEDAKTTLRTAPDLVTTAISLPNSSLNILLTTPQGVVLDHYSDTDSPDFGSSNPSTSIERDLISLNWRTSTQRLNLASTVQLGTPNNADLPPTPELAPITAVMEPVVTTPTPSASPVPDETTNEPVPEPVIETPTVVETVQEPSVTTPAELPSPCTQVVPEESTSSLTMVETPVNTSVSEPITTSWPIPEPEVVAEATATTPVSPISQAVSEPVSTPVVQIIKVGDLILNELVSDPTDSTEWVELFNDSDITLNLSGVALKDAGNHTTNLPDVELVSGAYFIIENPSGNLNNDSETMNLFNAQGLLLDTLTYGSSDIPAPQDGESLARTSDGGWSVTTATRNAANTFIAAVTDTQENSNSETTATAVSESTSPIPYATNTNELYSPSSDSGTVTGPVEATDNTGSGATESVHRIVAIAKSVTEKADKTKTAKTTTKVKTTAETVTITGTVVALPDTFGKQVMFLNGQEIYFNAAEWPELKLGDVVSVSGTMAAHEGAERLKIKTADDISITGHNELTAAPVDGAEVAEAVHGSLVSVSGRVVGKNGDKLTLSTEDGTQLTIVAPKKTGVSWSSMQSGTAIISGIVRVNEDGVRIYVRSTDDVHFTADAIVTETTPTKLKKNASSPLVGGGLLTGSLGALGTWYMRTRHGWLAWFPF